MLPARGYWTKGAWAVNVLPQGVQEGDFERIEAAVRETARGRWFLDEFAHRVRATEGVRVASALDRLEARAALGQAAEGETRDRIRRVVSMLAALVEGLNGHEEKPAIERPGVNALAAPRSEAEASLDALAPLDALSVADKLKLFR